MLDHVFDKLAMYYELDNNEDILIYLPSDLEEDLSEITISYTNSDGDIRYGDIVIISHDERNNEWIVELDDDSKNTFSDLPSQDCYYLLKILMNNGDVSEILNNDLFKEINKTTIKNN